MATPTTPTTPIPTPESPTKSSGQVQAQTSFFNALLKTGYDLTLKVNNVDWKTFQYRFVSESCALECREDNKPNGKLISFISLRKFAISYSPTDPLRFSIKTPNRLYQARVRDHALRTLWLGWLDSVQLDSHVMAEHAYRLTGRDTPMTLADKQYRPPFWVPKSEGDWCAACHTPFKAFSNNHTCRDCGYLYCSSDSCYTDGQVKRCNNCVTTYQNVNFDGTVKKDNAHSQMVPHFNENTSSRTHTYFQDLNEDPLIRREREAAQRKKEHEERQKLQLVLGEEGLARAGTIQNGSRPGTNPMNNRAPDVKLRNAQRQRHQEQLYSARESQRVVTMKKNETKSTFADIIIIGLIIAMVLYYFFPIEIIKGIFDMIMKNL